MNDYLQRLKRIGYKPHEAVQIIECFYKYFDSTYLNAFITSIENEKGIQDELFESKPLLQSLSKLSTKAGNNESKR